MLQFIRDRLRVLRIRIKHSLIKISGSTVPCRRLTPLGDKSRSAAFFLPPPPLIFGTPIPCAGDVDITSILTAYNALNKKIACYARVPGSLDDQGD